MRNGFLDGFTCFQVFKCVKRELTTLWRHMSNERQWKWTHQVEKTRATEYFSIFLRPILTSERHKNKPNSNLNCFLRRKQILLFTNFVDLKLVHVLSYFRTLFWDDIRIIWDENIVFYFNWEKNLCWTNKKFVYLIVIIKSSWYHPKAVLTIRKQLM